MKIAVVDIGSNTIKMKIFNYNNCCLNEIYSDVKNTKLISHISNGLLSAEGITLLCQTISLFKISAQDHKCDIFKCFATASLRRTSNISKITETVELLCDQKIDLISGKDEAYYSFSGVKNTINNFPDDCILLDMGGGSTELVICKNKEYSNACSMNFGSLSLYLDHPENQFELMKAHAADCLKKSGLYPVHAKNAILVGGTALAINKIYVHYYDVSAMYKMSYSNLLCMYNELKKLDNKTKKLLQDLVPHRVTTVIPGLSAYLSIFEQCGIENITVSTCGIREGYVYEKILKSGDYNL